MQRLYRNRRQAHNSHQVDRSHPWTIRQFKHAVYCCFPVGFLLVNLSHFEENMQIALDFWIVTSFHPERKKTSWQFYRKRDRSFSQWFPLLMGSTWSWIIKQIFHCFGQTVEVKFPPCTCWTTCLTTLGQNPVKSFPPVYPVPLLDYFPFPEQKNRNIFKWVRQTMIGPTKWCCSCQICHVYSTCQTLSGTRFCPPPYLCVNATRVEADRCSKVQQTSTLCG